MVIRAMTIEDYDEVFAMWQITSKRALSSADERSQMERYLKRNEGLSQVAVIDGKIIGTVLAGHDGRRGFIHHMAVLPEYRRRRIGHALAEKAIEMIRSATKTTRPDKNSGAISALSNATTCLFSAINSGGTL